MCSFVRWPRKVAQAGLLGLFILISHAVQAQDDDFRVDSFKAVPILTGSTAYFTRVTAGQYQDAPSVSPLLLLPMGDKWLLEAKGSYSDTFSKNAQGDYNGKLARRTYVLKINRKGGAMTGVSRNGAPLVKVGSRGALNSAEQGWFKDEAGGTVWVKFLAVTAVGSKVVLNGVGVR